MKGHTGICRPVKVFGQPWLEELARGTESELERTFDERGARLAVRPIRISHLFHVGEGIEIALFPEDPGTWTWWGAFESDLEVRRRRRFDRNWKELRTREEIRRWIRGTAKSYEAELRMALGAQHGDRQ